MLSSLLITLREGLEAALLIGIVLALLARAGGGDRVRAVWGGVAAALVVSLVAGLLLFVTGAELEGVAEEVFEAAAMILAAAVLSWMILWMRRQARTLTTDMGGRVQGALVGGSAALFWLGFAIVVREGLETALFLFAAVGDEGGLAELAGALVGSAAAVLVGIGVYRGGLRLDLRRVFGVLNVVLLGFGAYLLWGAAGELGELVGGEAGEAAGPVTAGAYLAVMIWLYRRSGRDDGQGRGVQRPAGASVGAGTPRGAIGRPDDGR